MAELNVRVEDVSPVLKRVCVDVPVERVSAVTEAVYRRLGRTARLPGYRPGHVPRRVLEKHFAEQVREDVSRAIVSETFDEAIQTTNLSPVASPTVEPAEFRPGEAFTYSARVEVRPEVQLQKYRGLEITVPSRTVTDEQVQAELDRHRERTATLVPVEGRDVAAMGDIAVVDYRLEVSGQDAPPPEQREGTSLHVEPGSFLEGKAGKLEGMQISGVREVTETFEGEGVPPKLAGREARIHVVLRGLKRREVHELNDDYAKEYAGVDTLDEFRAQVREGLERQASEQGIEDRKRALLEKLIEENPLEVPPALVERTAYQTVENLLGSFRRGGEDIPPRLVQELLRVAEPKALADVKGIFLLEAVARAEGLEPTPEEIEARVEEIAQRNPAQAGRVRTAYAAPERREGLASALRTEKALALLESAAQITTQ